MYPFALNWFFVQVSCLMKQVQKSLRSNTLIGNLTCNAYFTTGKLKHSFMLFISFKNDLHTYLAYIKVTDVCKTVETHLHASVIVVRLAIR